MIHIERVPGGPEDPGERRFFLIAEVTFRDWGEDNYYSDDELLGRIEDWVDSATDDRDDHPIVLFHELDRSETNHVKEILRAKELKS